MRMINRATTVAALTLSVVATLLTAPSRAVAQDAESQESLGSRASALAQDSAGQFYSVASAHRVEHVLAGGTRVQLGDDTMWEVYLPDRPAVDRWRRGDVLIVREASISQGEFNYTLVNGRTRDRVAARFGGEAPADRR